MKKILISFLGIFVFTITVSLAWYYLNFQKFAPETYIENKNGVEVTTNSKTGETSDVVKKFTNEEISSHNNLSSCYSSISGYVYDLTTFINMHPGGQKPIMSICGKDGTELFTKKHRGGQKYVNALYRFKIGKIN